MPLLSPSRHLEHRPPAVAEVVVAVRPVWVDLDRAITLAVRRRAVLHVVVTGRRPTPLAVLLGLRTARHGLDDRLERAGAMGVHVEVHRAKGCPAALSAGIAETLGAHLVRRSPHHHRPQPTPDNQGALQ